MAKKGGSDDVISGGNETWNVAQGYVNLKILRPIFFLDQLETIAEFGTEEMDQDNYLNNSQINKRRMEALQRFASTLQQLIGNVKFAIKKEKRKDLVHCEERIAYAKKFIKNIAKDSENTITHENDLYINEDLFMRVFRILQEVKNEVNDPINASGLIFRESGEIDLDKIMKDIVEGG